jgi:hypothetical protein
MELLIRQSWWIGADPHCGGLPGQGLLEMGKPAKEFSALSIHCLGIHDSAAGPNHACLIAFLSRHSVALRQGWV